MKKIDFGTIKRTILALCLAIAMCFSMTACSGGSESETAQSENTTTASDTDEDTRTDEDTDSSADEDTDESRDSAAAADFVEYTTADTKFEGPAGLEGEEGISGEIMVFDNINTHEVGEPTINVYVYDVGYWTTNPHPNGTPKTEEEFDPEGFFMNTGATTLDFEYSEDDESESVYAAVEKASGNITYAKYYVDKNDPSRIIYMEADTTGETEESQELIESIVKSFDWK